MDRVCLHAAPVTKLRAMRREILSDEEMETLMRSDHFASFLDLARRYTVFEDLPAHVTDQDGCEHYLEQRFRDQVQKIIRFYPISYRLFFHTIQERFRVEEIKQMARERGMSATLELAALKPCWQTLLMAARVKAEDSLFQLEMSLDQVYFQNLRRSVKRLEAQDRKIARDFIGVHIDINNLRWMARARKYYGLSPSLIFNYTLDGGLRFTVADLYEICRMSEGEFASFAENSPYREIFRSEAEARPALIEAWLLAWIRRRMAESPMSIAAFLAFLHEFEYQLRDLSTMMEAQLFAVDMSKWLVRKQVL